jgi:hypothetical protein
MDVEMLWRIIDEGSTPAIALVAYFLWKVERALTSFITEVRVQMETRDKKIHAIHKDITAVIRKLAGLQNGGN